MYKYLSENRIDILENCMIRYTQPGAMNDPFEFDVKFLKISKDKTLEKIYHETLQSLNYKLTEEQTRKLKKEFFEKELQLEAKERIKNEFQKFDKLLGILSLSDSYDNATMWAHYTNDYKGFIIGFKKDHKYFDVRHSEADEFRKLKKVTYKRNENINFDKLKAEDIFYAKNENWAYEQEYRIIKSLSNATLTGAKDSKGYQTYLFDFPSDLIENIIIGHNMSEEKSTRIIELVSRKEEFSHIKIFKTYINKLDSKIDILPI